MERIFFKFDRETATHQNESHSGGPKCMCYISHQMFRNAVNRDLPEKQLHPNVIHLFHNVIHIILYFSVTALNQIHILIGFGRPTLDYADFGVRGATFSRTLFSSFRRMAEVSIVK